MEILNIFLQNIPIDYVRFDINNYEIQKYNQEMFNIQQEERLSHLNSPPNNNPSSPSSPSNPDEGEGSLKIKREVFIDALAAKTEGYR